MTARPQPVGDMREGCEARQTDGQDNRPESDIARRFGTLPNEENEPGHRDDKGRDHEKRAAGRNDPREDDGPLLRVTIGQANDGDCRCGEDATHEEEKLHPAILTPARAESTAP